MNLLTKILLGAGLGAIAAYGASKLIDEFLDSDDGGDANHGGRRDAIFNDLLTMPNESTTIPDARSYARKHR